MLIYETKLYLSLLENDNITSKLDTSMLNMITRIRSIVNYWLYDVSLLLKEKYQYKLSLSFQSYLHLNATEIINLLTF